MREGRRCAPCGAPAVLLVVGILLGLTGCEATQDLPPTQASSAHFRYHARKAADVQADILDRLERNRADFYQYMGLSGDSITDYYYFTDPDDLAKNGPCSLPQSDCTLGRSAFASVPFHEHELIHSYMYSVGAPSAPVLEGMAESVGCTRSASANSKAAEPDWRRVIQDWPSADLTLYASDERFVTYLLGQFTVPQTVKYYGADRFTLDPDTFALNFKAVWNVSLDSVWSAAVGSGAPEAVLPICPCAIDPITSGGGETSLVHPNAAEYRPISAADGPLTIDLSTNGYINVQNCVRDTPSMQVLQQNLSSRSTIVMQPDQDRYFLTFESQATDAFTASHDLALQSTCAGLSTFAAVTRASQLGLAAPRSGGPSWYIMISTAGPVTAQRSDGGTGNLALCTDCSLTNCQPLSSFSATASVADGAVLQFTPDSSGSTRGLDTASVVFY